MTAKGSSKKSLLDVALNKEYNTAAAKNVAVIQQALKAPKDQLTPKLIEELAKQGLSSTTICHLYNARSSHINDNPDLREAFDKGRSEIASRIRSSLISDALEKDNLQAKLYLDKIYGGDTEVKKLEVSVANRPLKDVSTGALLEIEFTVPDEDEDQS